MHLALCVCVAVFAIQSGTLVSGTVVDAAGAAIAGAIVRVETTDAVPTETRTGADGSFELHGNSFAQELRLRISANGFERASLMVGRASRDVRVTLSPAAFFEAVSVTASRSVVPRAEPSATISVLSSAQLESRAAVTIDDALKMVPGFTLFRRTSSRNSNPTAQGVTFRGLGGTGPSRALVLADGAPLNDAFGGWVYWDTLPQVAIDRVEVLRGGASDLFGADAIGGVVHIVTWRPNRLAARALLEAGTLGSWRASVFGGGRFGRWDYGVGGESFNTDGYVSVAADQDPGIAPRGPIDTEWGSSHRSGIVSVGYQTEGSWRAGLHGRVYSADRENGTPAVVNDTRARRGGIEIAGVFGGGHLSARASAAMQDFHQTYSAISADRTTESLNRIQNVPSRAAEAGATYVRPAGRHTLLVGVEARRIKGTTREVQLSDGRQVAATARGGSHQIWSAFVQDSLAVSDQLTVVVGARADRWHTVSTDTSYQKTVGSLSPRASALLRLGDAFSLRGSAYAGFRAPTLNEQYRGFRSGNVQTNPSESLMPENLKGGDLGILFARPAFSARVTGFFNVLDDVIANVTVSATPQLITKIRANAEQLRAAGLEFETDLRLSPALSVGVSGAIVRSHFTINPSLRGKRTPQVPSSNVGVQIGYGRRQWVASSQVRVTGRQFEDDLNLFVLRPAVVMDVLASRALLHGASAFVAVENLWDVTYDVGRTPTLTVGMPRTVRIGMRLAVP